ncbi:MAG: amino acid adenylation domain-containing protein [Christensenella sp.]|nr:amino acid adenylation domain-containing protein [Christensenella sp.]
MMEKCETFALSLSQQNIWNIEQSYQGTSINNISSTMRIKGRFDVAALQACLNAVVKADASLRTRIVLDGENPVQYYEPFQTEQFPVFDFSQAGIESVSHWEEAAAKEPIPLMGGPLYRFLVFRVGENEGGVLVKTHHMISDGWSQVLLGNRLSQAYLDVLAGKPLTMEEVPDYRLHVATENQYLQSRTHEKDKAYWDEVMAAQIEPAAVKKIKSAETSPIGRRKTFLLSEVLNHAIQRFCTENQVAPFAVFYMALAVYLRRIGGAGTVSMGVPIHNRSDFKEKQMTGMFVSTIPFICGLDENWNFEEFNQHMKESWFDLLRHQKIPFSEIGQIAKSHHPDLRELFHVVLSYQNGQLFKNKDASVSFSGRWHYNGYQAESLVIHVSSLESIFRFSVDYDYHTQTFSAGEIRKLHYYLIKIISDAMANPKKPIWQLALLSHEEEEQVLFGFNHTDRFFKHRDIAEVLEKTVRGNPSRVALISGGTRLRYDQLWNTSKCYAKAIRKVCPEGSLVAISLRKGIPMLQAMLGAVFAGCAWVILPDSLPEERKRTVLSKSGAQVLVTTGQAEWADGIPILRPEAIIYEDNCGFAPYQAQEDDLAYVVYTSGSTGEPKGVEIQQGNLLNFAAAMEPYYGRGGVLSLSNTGFDVFVLESIVSLLNGCTVVLAEEDVQEDPDAIASLIRDYGIGFFAITPSRLRTYLNHERFACALSRVESIICGGEHISGELVELLAQHSKAKLYNQYGPSETTVGVSMKQINDAAHITAGKPMDNCRMYVLDAKMQPLPIGVYGDLYIGGKCVGRGYRGQTELTEQSFVESPFEQGERIYRTGDIACWTPDGEIMIGGREDDQVKLRGLRIELQEIAQCLMRHPKVGQAAVKLIENGSSRFLAAYYTANASLPSVELLKFMAMYLPGYMLPARLIYMEQMPVSANGKINVAALPKPEVQCSGTPAQNRRQEILLGIYREMLPGNEIDIDSDYFLCGGDSLSAVETVCRICENTGVEIKVADLYMLRTVRNLDEGMPGSGVAPATQQGSISAAPLLPSYPLSPVQQNLLVQALWNKEGVAYNMPGAFVLGNDIDIPKLSEALRGLVREEELLRTSFVLDEKGARQIVRQQVDFDVPVLQADCFEDAAHVFVRPFDVENAPLFRAALWHDSENWVLLIDTHHIISDGLSSRILMKRLDALYCGNKTPENRLFYKDYAYWLANREDNGEQLSYWKEKFSRGVSPLSLPTDYSRKKTFDYTGAKQECSLGKNLSEQCRAYCAKQGLSIYMLLAGTYAILLSKLAVTDDVTFGTPVSGRARSELWEMFGAFINTLPLRLSPKKDAGIEEYFADVKSSVLGMLDSQEVSVEKIISIAGAARSTGQNALYNALFSYRPITEEEFCLNGEQLLYRPIGTGTAKFDLSLEAVEKDGGISMVWEYANALFEENTIALYARCFAQALTEITGGKCKTLSEIGAISGEDRIRLLETPKYMRTPYVDLCLDKIIDQIAEIMPESPAVYTNARMLTYRSLVRHAEDYAAQLKAAGAQKGDFIGLSCRRDEETLAAILGILKAGCAYIPMLPSLPESRMRYMLEISKAVFVFCDSSTAAKIPQGLPCPTVIMSLENREWTPLAGRSSEDDIHIIFTSGSTGQPKGSVLQHRAIANLLADVRTKYEGTGGNAMCVSSMMFDTFLIESLLPLALGKAVVMADEEEMMLPWKLAKLILERDVRSTFMTPSRWQMCLSNEEFCKAMDHFELVMAGGEVVSDQLTELFRETSNATIYNLYGPSEAAVYVTSADITSRKKSVIGKANPNCRLYVLDENQKPVLPTAVGELYIAGECLARGYIGRPDLTAEAFVPDPFFSGQKMYRSGDLVRLLPDLHIDYVGRHDMQVKLNGQRIELSEITGEILRFEQVKEAAVIAVKKEDGSAELRAFLVAEPEKEIDVSSLKIHLEQHLPKYMIPSTMIRLSELPQTPTGKTDLRALEKYGVSRKPKTEPAKDEPQTIVGRITAIWENALERTGLDPETSFFDQGGTSLAALHVLGQYFKNGWKMPLSDFYDHPTIAEHAKMLGDSPQDSGGMKAAASGNAETRILPETVKLPEMISNTETPHKEKVLITGATGFLGAHLVKELVDKGHCCVCIVRGGSQSRLDATLGYYFGSAWVSDHTESIRAVAGDISKPGLGMEEEQREALARGVGQIVHTAADVRHHAPEEEAMCINCEGTRQITALAMQAGARLLYVSTLSVGAEYLEADPQRKVIFTEKDFDIGQNWKDNVYVKTKFLAERAVREAMAQGLHAKIFRVGRLVGRQSDGVFQQKPEANAFYGIIRGLCGIGIVPEEYAAMPVDLTPVDLCARAILLLAEAEGNVFHVSNPNTVALQKMMEDLGYPLREVQATVFERALLEKITSGHPERFYPVIEVWNRFEKSRQVIEPGLSYTVAILQSKGFIWPGANAGVLLREFAGEEEI